MQNDCYFDFPCSDTFRRYEDHLLGRESLPRDDGKTWAERCFDDDLRDVRRCRLEAEEGRLDSDTGYHTESHRKLWDKMRQLEVENEDLRRRFEFEAWHKKAKMPSQPKKTHNRVVVEL